MCGEHFAAGAGRYAKPGSSPHVRGAPVFGSHTTRVLGIIPACAGSTLPNGSNCRTIWDHPRMCGEHSVPSSSESLRAGSSPHVRGAPEHQLRPSLLRGIIPACAGSTYRSSGRACARRDHPRMCGEHFLIFQLDTDGRGSSPHVRGAPFENSIIPRKRKDNWLFFIQFRFENFLAFRYLLALLHPFLGVPTKDPSFASLGRLINCNPSQSTGDQSAPYTLKAICCSFLAE